MEYVFPEIFESSFLKGTEAKWNNFVQVFYPFDIGQINIASGKIIACDPINIHAGIAFAQEFPIGQFHVQLAIAKGGEDERVGFSRILFSDNEVVKWEFALPPGQEQISITGDICYAYGVDSGTGLFIDEEANKIFNQKDLEVWNEVFITSMEKYYRNTWSYILHEFDGYNLAAFSTGLGDGHYATYVGYDSQGNICRLLTEFGLIDWLEK